MATNVVCKNVVRQGGLWTFQFFAPRREDLASPVLTDYAAKYIEEQGHKMMGVPLRTTAAYPVDDHYKPLFRDGDPVASDLAQHLHGFMCDYQVYVE